MSIREKNPPLNLTCKPGGLSDRSPGYSNAKPGVKTPTQNGGERQTPLLTRTDEPEFYHAVGSLRHSGIGGGIYPSLSQSLVS